LKIEYRLFSSAIVVPGIAIIAAMPMTLHRVIRFRILPPFPFFPDFKAIVSLCKIS
jgi:hypothetical protein